MTTLYEQSEGTAARRRWFFGCVDDTDGVTAETGLTFSGAELQISKNGAAFASFAGTATELTDGLYYYEATSGELDTLGVVAFKVEKTGVRTMLNLVGQVVPWDPYASQLTANTTHWNGTAVATPTTAGVPRVDVKAMEANTLTATAIAADAITAAKLAADVTTELQAGLATAAALTVVDDFLDTEIAAIKAKTDNLPVDPASAAGIPSASSIVDALMAYSHDTGVTIKGLFRRLEANVSGKMAGALGSVIQFFRRDGVTVATEVNQTIAAGTRNTGTVTGSEV